MPSAIRIHILSDLHLEFESFEAPAVEADIVVLAGDIAPGVAGLQWAAVSFPTKPVVYVPGNHEFYGLELRGHRQAMAEEARRLGIHLLDDQALVIDGIRFLGATLWTDFLLYGIAWEWPAREAARRGMTDCRVIRDGSQLLLPERMAQVHARSRVWLETELRRPHPGRTVVVTHHLPSRQSVAPRFDSDVLSAAFASDLDDLVVQADLWIHGHTHDSFDYELGDCRVVCNPKGYRGENADGFQPGLVVTLER